MNIFKTGFLMAAMTFLLMFAGAMLGGQHGMIVALGFALFTNFFAYWFSDKIVLAMYRAKEVDRNSAPRLYEIVERLARKADLPMPRVYIIPSDSPNAFATGRNPSHAAVAVTQALHDLLDDRELGGVLAHELAHVKHRDILIGTIVGTMAGAISSLAWFAKWGAIFGGFGGRDRDGGTIGLLIMAIVAPIVALLVQMAISRSREYHADQKAGELTGDPLSLSSALARIHRGIERQPMVEAGQATAHLFIASPLSGRSFASLFSTHPPMEERVRRLEEQARRFPGGYSPGDYNSGGYGG